MKFYERANTEKHLNAKLIKIDRNGSKYYEGLTECDRCQGRGWFATGVCNGELVPSRIDQAVCWKCHGAQYVPDRWIERTPEYQAKLDAKRAAKAAELQAEREAEEARIREEEARLEAEREAARKAEEARILAEKAVSQYVGTVGQPIEVAVQYIGSPYFERKAFGGYGVETCYIHTFKDEHGNKIVWMTGSGLGKYHINELDHVIIRATVKEHKEYKGEKQTSILRCKVIAC